MMFGINPGYSKINNPKEDFEARISWRNYVTLYQNFFTYFERNNLGHLITLHCIILFQALVDKWKLFDRCVSNLELSFLKRVTLQLDYRGWLRFRYSRVAT
jgi:hypothetical protein